MLIVCGMCFISFGSFIIISLVHLSLFHIFLYHFLTVSRAGPRGVLYGGALQAEDLNRAVQAVSGVRKPLLI